MWPTLGLYRNRTSDAVLLFLLKLLEWILNLRKWYKQVQELTQNESMQPLPAQRYHLVLLQVVPQGTRMLAQCRQEARPPSLVLHLTSPERSSPAPLPSLTRWPQIQCTVEISNFTMLPINNLPVKVYSTNLLRLDFFFPFRTISSSFIQITVLSIVCPWDHLS